MVKHGRHIDVLYGVGFIAIAAWGVYLFFTDPLVKSTPDIVLTVALTSFIAVVGLWHLYQAYKNNQPPR